MSETKYKVKLSSRVKYNNERYVSGDSLELDAAEYADFKGNKLIDDAHTQEIEVPSEDKTTGLDSYTIEELEAHIEERKNASDSKKVEDMVIAELKEYAAENNIDLGSTSKRDDILEVIQKAESGKEDPPGEE